MPPGPKQVERVLHVLRDWAEQESDVVGLLLVGSWASGRAKDDSDIDVMALAANPARFRETEDWIHDIAWEDAGLSVREWLDEDYGVVWSRHLLCESGLEVELSFAEVTWAAVDPVDPGTVKLVRSGCRIVYDPCGHVSSLISALRP